MISFPVLFVNFKTYQEATGKNAVLLAGKIESAARQSGRSAVVVAQPADILRVSSSVSLPVFAQHIDPVDFGSNTGSILPESVKESGASGTVLNHAERKLSNDVLEKSIARAKNLGLMVLACAETAERAKLIASFRVKPDFIAIEPPELIGGEISVSTAKPSLISDSVNAVNSVSKIPVLTGAGIKNSADVSKAVALGTVGVFVASGIVKAKDPKAACLELFSGFNK